jgi:dTDP-4-dehydrorhamnose 3,5-epimerase
MKFTETSLQGAFVVELEKREDARGFFARSWCEREFDAHGLVSRIAQANVSYNRYRGTLRGFHYQIEPHQETKVIRCTRGAIYDVILDLRPESPTYTRWVAVKLRAELYNMVYVPRGCANAFYILSDHTEAFYMSSEFYAPECERGVRWNDPLFAVQWPAARPTVISDKDGSWPDYCAQR